MQALLGVLGIFKHHLVIVAICVAALVLLAAVIFALRKGRVLGRIESRRRTLETAAPPGGQQAQALLREWAGEGLHSSSRGAAVSAAPGKETPTEPTEIDLMLKLVDLFEKKLLTREEFEEEKRLLLERRSADPAQPSQAPRPPGG